MIPSQNVRIYLEFISNNLSFIVFLHHFLQKRTYCASQFAKLRHQQSMSEKFINQVNYAMQNFAI